MIVWPDSTLYSLSLMKMVIWLMVGSFIPSESR
jgi:hypothetical protein